MRLGSTDQFFSADLSWRILKVQWGTAGSGTLLPLALAPEAAGSLARSGVGAARLLPHSASRRISLWGLLSVRWSLSSHQARSAFLFLVLLAVNVCSSVNTASGRNITLVGSPVRHRRHKTGVISCSHQSRVES